VCHASGLRRPVALPNQPTQSYARRRVMEIGECSAADVSKISCPTNRSLWLWWQDGERRVTSAAIQTAETSVFRRDLTNLFQTRHCDRQVAQLERPPNAGPVELAPFLKPPPPNSVENRPIAQSYISQFVTVTSCHTIASEETDDTSPASASENSLSPSWMAVLSSIHDRQSLARTCFSPTQPVTPSPLSGDLRTVV
jgi:hypothetical protein